MNHDPTDYKAMTYLFYAGIAIAGGLVAKLQYWVGGNPPHCWRCASIRLAVDLITSGFVGLLTFFACEALELPQHATAVAVGISGHLGSRTLFLIENVIIKRIKQLSNSVPVINDHDSEDK